METINKETIKGNWNQVKGKLKKTYADLTDDDLTFAEGHENELIGKIQEKTGEAKEKIIELIKSV